MASQFGIKDIYNQVKQLWQKHRYNPAVAIGFFLMLFAIVYVCSPGLLGIIIGVGMGAVFAGPLTIAVNYGLSYLSKTFGSSSPNQTQTQTGSSSKHNEATPVNANHSPDLLKERLGEPGPKDKESTSKWPEKKKIKQNERLPDSSIDPSPPPSPSSP